MKQSVTSAAAQYAEKSGSGMSWQEHLRVVIKQLAQEDLDLVDGASLHEDVVELFCSIERLVGCNAKRLAKWAKNGTWADDDSRSAASRLSRETGSSLKEAKREVRRAIALQDMPISSAALVDNKLSLPRVDLLVNANNSRVSGQFLRDEALVTVEKLKRTPAQRRCDALVEMAKRSSSVGPTYKESLPLISIVVGKSEFDRVCELASGTVLSPRQVVPHLTKCQIERIVFDGENRILEIGPSASLTVHFAEQFRSAMVIASTPRCVKYQQPNATLTTLFRGL